MTFVPSHRHEKQSGDATLGRRGDLWIALGVAVVTFALLLPNLDVSWPSLRRSVVQQPDEGTVLSNADRVSRGHALYREAFDFKGPMGYLPYVIAFKFAPATARIGRLTMFAIISWWAAVMYAIVRRIAGRRFLAVVVALLVPLQIWPTWSYAYQDFTAQLFLAIAVLAAMLAFDGARHGYAVAGAAAAWALWTSLAQGLTGLVALGVSIGMVAGIASGARVARKALARFCFGALLATAAVFAWLTVMGAVKAGLWAMLIFPFKHYMSGSNAVPYGYDEDVYPDLWADGPGWVFWATKIMVKTVHYAPFVALGTAGLIGAGLLVSVARHRGHPLSRSIAAFRLAPVAIPPALAATAIPLVMGETRADLCHLGFVEGGCLIAIGAIFAVRSRQPVVARGLRFLRVLVTVALSGVLLAAAVFFVHALRVKPPGFVDLDALGRIDYETDLIQARTRPDDRILVTSYGGWSYLYSRRDNATSYALLFDDPYCVAQWPIAARQIRERRPLLLMIPDTDFEILQGHEPILGQMYFGYSGNYMLDDRGEGPPFPVPARWSLELSSGGAVLDRFVVGLRGDGGSARLLASIPGVGWDIRAAIHRDVFSLFMGDETYVGRVSREGTRMSGTIFGPEAERRSFSGVRIGP